MTSELLDVLHDLKTGMLALRHEAERPLSAPALAALRAAVEAVGQDQPARVLVCPEEYLQAWRSLAAGSRMKLSARAARYLSWEPDVVLDPAFHHHVDEQVLNLGARGLQGLVRACHLRWPAFVTDETVQRIAVRRLSDYRGSNRVVIRWQGSVDRILGVGAPQELASWMLEGLRTPQATALEWRIDVTSTFFLDAMRALLKRARGRWRGKADTVSFVCREILDWEGWPIDTLKVEAAESILHPDARDAEVTEPLKAFILRHPNLGDPRLPEKRTNWLGVRPEARQRLIEWLSRDDIVFFFDHAFPRGEDRHRRKPFWLKYVSRVVMSRPLLSQEDAARLRSHLRQHGAEVGNFGKIFGNNSAFLLDFGEVCAIEFNHVGACYVYARRAMDQVVPDFWAREYFSESGLKRKHLCLQRIIHRPGWEQELQQTLARYGVRP